MTTVGATEDNQSAEISQICTESQESRDNINEGKDEWVILLENYVEETIKTPQIELVPFRMRKIESNSHCYDPLVVSIGPYHHGKSQLEAFEKLKIPVAHKFVHACGNQVSIIELYEKVAKLCESAREYYVEASAVHYTDEMFNRMMFLDACFVLHFLSYLLEDTEQDEVDQQLNMSGYFVCRDLFLLENQIPFIVLKVLIEFRFKGKKIQTILFFKRVAEYFTITPRHGNSWTNAVKNFLAQMTGCYSKSDREEIKRESLFDSRSPHLLHLVREHFICPYMQESQNKRTAVQRESFRSVTMLKSAGIHFIPSQTGNLTDVKFESRLIYGTLTLPPILADGITKYMLLNLVAYENSPSCPVHSSIASYIYLMGSLIAGPDDVKELRKKRIIVDWSGSDEEGVYFFKEMAHDLVPPSYAYADVRYQIQMHCQKKLPAWVQTWMAEEWIQKYFSSTWAFMALLGAIIALLLTAVQTYFTVFPRKT